MAYALIGGLISSTLLTLVFVPVVLNPLDGMTAWTSCRLILSIAEEPPPGGQ